MKRSSKILLKEVLSATEQIELFIAGFNRRMFMVEEKTKSAVVRQFEIIGEAINSLPDELKNQYHEVEWYKAVGLRNALIHGYFKVDYDLVWKTIKEDLPRLRKQIKEILKK